MQKLLRLAPRPVHPILNLPVSTQTQQQQVDMVCQSILVTNYVNSQTLIERQRQATQNKASSEWLDDNFWQQEANDNEIIGKYYNRQLSSDNSTELSSDGNEAIAGPFPEEESNVNDKYWSASSESSQRKKTVGTIEADNLPWPDGHRDFLKSVSARQNLCLEIACGYAVEHEATWIDVHRNIRNARGLLSTRKMSKHPLKDCHVPTLLPGSLRERGEFCILELALIDQQRYEKSAPKQHQHSTGVAKADHRRFAWEVQNVKFHRME